MLAPNTSVRIYSKSKYGNWTQRGKILSKRSEPRSYNVLNERGDIIRRNRWQLKPTKEAFNDEISYDDYHADDSEIENNNQRISSENDIESQIEPNTNTTDNNEYVTQSGRIVRPPDRLGYP